MIGDQGGTLGLRPTRARSRLRQGASLSRKAQAVL